MDIHEKLPAEGEEIKLCIRSIVYANGIPEMPASFGDGFLPDEEFADEGDEGDADYPQKIEQVMLATLSEENGRVTISYDDSEILELPPTLTQITFTKAEPGLVSIVRSGGLKSMIIVEEGRRHTGEYRLGPYSIPVSFYGRRVRNGICDGDGTLELEYAVEMSGSDTQITKMKITVSR